ncbi:hypothetical protein QR98_0081490 [Sarcoptes scabiei]|uniref:Uncharacterized protein n=1 Tax=Sarcoptes scabiei TaxID=52283 RepID=A0A132AGN8_SARSC|nr:hypothetical protein QR98_0081490 [Sarcoptes scabiei]
MRTELSKKVVEEKILDIGVYYLGICLKFLSQQQPVIYSRCYIRMDMLIMRVDGLESHMNDLDRMNE